MSWARKRRNVRRLARIAEIATKHGFGYLIEKYGLKQYLSKKERAKEFKETQAETVGRRLKSLLEDLGPTFIKIGQLISVRPDLAPPEVLFELEKLQDTVEPFEFETVERAIEQELGAKVSDIFDDFDPTPIAAASIGQVHRAHLKKNGVEVAVKVQRPKAQETIESDLDLIFTLAGKVKGKVEFIDLVGVVQEFSESLHRELDYRIEGRHVDRFRHNFRGDNLIRIPLVFWDYSSRRVLTLEYIEGTKLNDLATPEAQGIDTFHLAKYGAEAFMKQVLEHGFFHGDLHPANLLITPDAKIAYLDFGIMGQIAEKDKETIAFLLMAIIKQDVPQIIARAEDLGVIIPKETISKMKEEFKEILDRYHGKKLKEIKIDIIGLRLDCPQPPVRHRHRHRARP